MDEELIKNLEEKVKCLQKEIEDLKKQDNLDIDSLEAGLYLVKSDLGLRLIGKGFYQDEVVSMSVISLISSNKNNIQEDSYTLNYKLIKKLTEEDLRKMI